MKFGLALKQKAIALKLNRHPILGCSDEQILKVMRVQNVKRLPEIYRQYLKVMGRASGDIYLGTDVTFDYLLKLKTWAKSLLLEDKRTFLLPEDAFVFLMHQGYQFLYFYTNNDEDNPPIFHYIQDQEEDEPCLYFEQLAEFLTIFIAEEDKRGNDAQLEFLIENT